jgi:hypothetical protein
MRRVLAGCMILLMALPMAAHASPPGEFSLRIGGPTYLSSHTTGGFISDNTWHLGGNVLWSPRSRGTSNLLLGVAYWRQEIDDASPTAGVTFDVVPIQCGARFHFGDESRRKASLFVEVTPTLTYTTMGIQPKGDALPYEHPTTEYHLLLGSALAAVVPLALSKDVGVEFGGSLFWTEGFATDSYLVRWVDGITVVALQAGLSWR